MGKRFNLIELHDETDIHPRSWICFSGEKLSKQIAKLEATTLKKLDISRESLSKKIAKELGCSNHVIKRALKKKKFVPIPVIVALLHYAEKNHQIQQINSNIDFIKVNSASAKPVKACKVLSSQLSSILGAFMADGSMHATVIFSSKKATDLNVLEKRLHRMKINYVKKFSKSRKEHYVDISINRNNCSSIRNFMISFSKQFNIQTHTTIELMDFYKENVEVFNSWIFNQFKIHPTNFSQRGNAWRSFFCNKIFSRYLVKFFGVIPGPKSHTAFEPKIIKSSTFRLRRDFAKGVMMFDGCLSLEGIMSIELSSKSLISSLKNIFAEDGIVICAIRTNHVIRTKRSNNINKLTSYFEKGTPKHERIRMIKGERGIEKKLDSNSPNSLIKILKTIKKVKTCDIRFLTKKFGGIVPSTIMPYLRILQKHSLIRLQSRATLLCTEHVDEKIYIKINKPIRDALFAKLKIKFKEHQKVARYLGVSKKTFSLWKLGKNRIPLLMLMKMTSAAEMTKEEVLSDIESTDRLICSSV